MSKIKITLNAAKWQESAGCNSLSTKANGIFNLHLLFDLISIIFQKTSYWFICPAKSILQLNLV
jgi:hypothetical protein